MKKSLMAWLLALTISSAMVHGQSGGYPSLLPDFDVRKRDFSQNPFCSTNQVTAVNQLKSAVPSARVSGDRLLGTPAMVTATSGFLSAPVTGFALLADPDAPVKSFLTKYAPLFGQDATLLTNTVVKRDAVSPRGGMRHKVWEQQLDGVPVCGGELAANTSSRGELVSISSRMVPNLEQLVSSTVPNHAALVAAPPVSAQEAVARAALEIGVQIANWDVAAAGQQNGWQFFTAPLLAGRSYLRLTWLPMGRNSVRLCWEVYVNSKERGQMYRVLLDAQSGQPLARRGVTRYLSDVTYNVWTLESPTPMLPGCPTPCTTQPSVVPRQLVTLSAVDTNASPNGWINDTDNVTTGNNVIASVDLNGDEIPDTPYPTGTGPRVFNYPIDLTKAPSTYQNGAVVQFFYYLNKAHDLLWQTGFNESAGNMQADNFGRGGRAGDPLLANAQSAAVANNAYCNPAPDGISPTLNMGVFDSVTPNRDSDLDQMVALHEMFHAVSDRLDGGITYNENLQSGAMQEGWSDFAGLVLNVAPGEDPNGSYPEGAYITYALGLNQNYYYGIRRYPYCTDMSKNPLTYKDIDDAQASSHSGVPQSPLGWGAAGAGEVHNAGEVWCSALWEMRAEMVRKYGDVDGNLRALQLVIDGLKLLRGGGDPNFLQARDAILRADATNFANADFVEIWRAFAKRGMGYSASSPNGNSTSGVVEAFDVPTPPSPLHVLSATVFGGNGNGVLDPNECNQLSIVLTNISNQDVAGPFSAVIEGQATGMMVTQPGSAWPDGVLAHGIATNTIPLFDISTAPSFLCGSVVDFTLRFKLPALGYPSTTFQLGGATANLGATSRFDNSTDLPIPDQSTVLSSNVVAGITAPIGKITVSLYLEHSYDSDLVVSLVAPDGTEIRLAANNGAGGHNFGTNCTDAARTVFDDAAAVSINNTNVSAPYVGTFQPFDSLAGFNGRDANGTWFLKIADTQLLDAGTLHCWSLFVTPAVCAPDAGPCVPIPADCIDKTALDFGSVILSQTRTERVTLSSCGTTNLIINGVTITGADTNDFRIVSQPCVGDIPVGNTCAVDVMFSPTGVGQRYTTLVIDDNSGGREVPLTGNGIDCNLTTIMPGSVPGAYLGAPYFQQLTMHGGTDPVIFFRAAGVYPPGITLTNNGVIAGVATTIGLYQFRVDAVDANGCHAQRWYQVRVDCGGITIGPSALPTGQAGTPYSLQFEATGTTGPYSFTQTGGSLPEGMTLSPDGLLSGTPTSASTYFEITAKDANGCVATKGYTLVLANPPPYLVLLPPALAPAITGTTYGQTLTARGGTGTTTFSVTSGALPAGLSLSTGGQLAGASTGAGVYRFTITAVDSAGTAGSQAYVMTVSAEPVDIAVGIAANTNAVIAGGSVDYTVTVTNLSAIAASDVTVTGTLWVANLGTLNAGAAVVTNLSRELLTVGSIVNSATVSCAEVDSVPANNSAQITTTVLPAPATCWLRFTAGAYLAVGNVGSVAVAVERVGDTNGTVAVTYATSDGTGVAGTDYQAATGVLTFAPGVTRQSFSVTVLNNPGGGNGSKTVNLTLTNPTSPAGLGSRNRAQLVIHRNGAAANFVSVTDADGDVVTVRLLGAGRMVLALAGANLGPIQQISLTGTDTKSKLMITVRKGAGGNGLLEVGSIVVAGSLKQINAPLVDVTGDGISLTGKIGNVRLHSLANPVITATSVGRVRLTRK